MMSTHRNDQAQTGWRAAKPSIQVSACRKVAVLALVAATALLAACAKPHVYNLANERQAMAQDLKLQPQDIKGLVPCAYAMVAIGATTGDFVSGLCAVAGKSLQMRVLDRTSGTTINANTVALASLTSYSVLDTELKRQLLVRTQQQIFAMTLRRGQGDQDSMLALQGLQQMVAALEAAGVKQLPVVSGINVTPPPPSYNTYVPVYVPVKKGK